jgi:anthranilate phosphoribosyltransferase
MLHDARSILSFLVEGGRLNETQAGQAFTLLLSGGFDEAQTAAFLALIQARGATADELTGAARVLRANLVPTPVPDVPGAAVIDTCGTGGAPKTFNVSTAAAFVIAGASRADPSTRRVLVAKHGNRSRTGRGSAEVLAALGVNVDAGPAVQTRCLERAGVCFCFAIHHHPAAKAAAGPRRSLGFPTIFNLLGPLANPAGVERQLMGTYRQDLAALLAQCLARLGTRRAIVVHSEDGLDEIAVSAPTRLWHVGEGSVREETIDPTAWGVPRAPLEAVQARDIDDAAALIRAVLEGRPGPTRDIVLLNAAAGLLVADAVPSFEAGLVLAGASLDSGAALGVLEELARTSHDAAAP